MLPSSVRCSVSNLLGSTFRHLFENNQEICLEDTTQSRFRGSPQHAHVE